MSILVNESLFFFLKQIKMKIKLLTFSLGDSFGAIMQAYALSYTLRKMGHEVELFNLTWYRSFKQQVYLTVTGVNHRFSKFRKNYLPD